MQAQGDEEPDVIIGQRVFGCEFIQRMGILLKLPQVGMCTAQVMFHRFYAKRSLNKFDVRHVAMGALFLATKVEECPRKVRDVINVYWHLEQKRAGQTPAPMDIYSSRYNALKERLIRAEREILKELGFILYCEHPHKFILNYVKLLTVNNETCRQLAQHAWNFCNDSQRTNVCIRFAPEVICCAAIWMAARVLQIKLPSHTSPPWWEIFDAKKEDMDAVCATIAALYSRPRAHFVRLEAPPKPPPAPAPAEPAPAPAAEPAVVSAPSPEPVARNGESSDPGGDPAASDRSAPAAASATAADGAAKADAADGPASEEGGAGSKEDAEKRSDGARNGARQERDRDDDGERRRRGRDDDDRDRERRDDRRDERRGRDDRERCDAPPLILGPRCARVDPRVAV